jgi:hypothetical protein
MKKQSRGIFMLWVLIVMAAAGGTFLLAEHLGVGNAPGGGMAPAATPDVDVTNDDSAVSGTVAAPVAMQDFSNSNDGYAFSVPASWNIEKTGSDTVAVHPDTSSSVAACKIEVSAFPYSAGADGMADWITHRIGADPSVAVTEQSSADVTLADGGTGVEWIGTMDGLPTILVYAFNGQHAYEIAPSVVGEGAAGDVQCNDMLQSFLSALKI